MPINTERLDLFKYDVVADANNTFNITKALNDNWDKIDNQTLLKNQITNCILEFPKMFDLDINVNTATLKAGSKVIIPYGTSAPTFSIGDSLNGGKIVEVSWDGSKLFYIVQYETNLTHTPITTVQGGSLAIITSPNKGPLVALWDVDNISYDSDTNIVSGGSASNPVLYLSLPIAHYSWDGSKFGSGSVSQYVYYVGNIIFIRKGLKVLIPNERNTDNSLKNIELTLDEDISRSGELKNVTGSLLIGSDKTLSINKYIEGYVLPSNFTGVFRNLDENTCYFYSAGTPIKERSYVNIGTGSVDAEGNVTSLNPYQPVTLAKEQDIDGIWTYNFVSLDNGTIGANQSKTYDVSDILPNDGNVYEVLLRAMMTTGSKSGNQFNLYIQTDIITDESGLTLGRNIARTNATALQSNTVTALVGAGRYIKLNNIKGNGNSNLGFSILAYRKVR